MSQQEGRSWFREVSVGVVVAVLGALIISRFNLNKSANETKPPSTTSVSQVLPGPPGGVPAAIPAERPTTATITVIRESAFSGALLDVDILIDGQKIGAVGNGARVKLPFSAKKRKHDICLRHSVFVTKAQMEFEAEPGSSIRVVFHIGGTAVAITTLERE